MRSAPEIECCRGIAAVAHAATSPRPADAAALGFAIEPDEARDLTAVGERIREAARELHRLHKYGKMRLRPEESQRIVRQAQHVVM